jgi:hypothetical protein
MVRIKGTEFRGELTGVAHTLSVMPGTDTHNPTAYSAPTYIVRLSKIFLIAPKKEGFQVVEGMAPSSFPGSLFVHELTRDLDQLELDE